VKSQHPGLEWGYGEGREGLSFYLEREQRRIRPSINEKRGDFTRSMNGSGMVIRKKYRFD